MTEYRIIKQGEEFIVQKKFLWWWSTERHALPSGGDLPLTSITRFRTIHHARDYIEHRRPKGRMPIEVVETRIIW